MIFEEKISSCYISLTDHALATFDVIIKPFLLYNLKVKKKKLNILRTKKAFKMKKKTFFVIFEEPSLKKIKQIFFGGGGGDRAICNS